MFKAIQCSPRETIFRTHAMIGYIEGFPNEAAKHTDIMYQHYDGMTPGWVMYYNKGIMERVLHHWGEAVEYFHKALQIYPSFEPARQELGKVWPLAPFPNHGPINKQMSEEGVKTLKFVQQEIQKRRAAVKRMTEEGQIAIKKDKALAAQYQANINQLQVEIANRDLAIINTVLVEKNKMNVPMDWATDIDNGIFLTPREVGEGQYQIQDTGCPGVVIARRSK